MRTMRTSHKEYYIALAALVVIMAVVWIDIWNLFHPRVASNFQLIVIGIELLLSFFLYTVVCLLEIRLRTIRTLNLLLFLIISFGVVSFLLLGFASIFVHYGLISSDNFITHNSLDCLYFSIITWTTVGYGDFRPTPDARLYAALEALTGVVFFSLFISTLIHVTNKHSELYRQIMSKKYDMHLK